jgi:hypothetical protein
VTAEGGIASGMNLASGKDLQGMIGLTGPIMPWWKAYQVTMVANEIAWAWVSRVPVPAAPVRKSKLP